MPIWSSTGSLSPAQNALQHWQRHRAEFPHLQNARQYIEEATNFFNTPPSTALYKVRASGDIIIYDPVSNIFGVWTASGVPRTLFRPNPSIHSYPTNLDYFNAQ